MGLFTRRRAFFKKRKTFTADEFVYSYLKNGGSVEMNVDGSSTPVVFEHITPNDKAEWLMRLTMYAHNTTIDPDNFLGVTALATGLDVQVLDDQDNMLKDFTNGQRIKKTLEFSVFSGNNAGDIISKLGASDEATTMRWTFSEAGEPIFMRAGYKFRVRVNDNISGVTQFRMMVQGIQVSKF